MPGQKDSCSIRPTGCGIFMKHSAKSFYIVTPYPVVCLLRPRPDSTNRGVFALSLPTNREKSFDHRDSIKSIERSEAKTTPFKTTDENGDDRIPPRRPWTDGRPRSIDRGLSSSSSSSSSSSTTRPHFHTLLAKRIASSSSSHPRLNYRALDSVKKSQFP